MQNRFNRKWAIPAIVVFVIGLYFVPPVHDRLAWRLDGLRSKIKYLVKPPDEVIFRPEEQAQLDIAVTAMMQTLQATLTPQASVSPVAIFLPVAWFMLPRVLFPAKLGELSGGRALIEEEYRKLGPLSLGEKTTLAVFAGAAFLWIFGPFMKDLSIAGVTPLKGLTDSGVAMLAALALFLLPADRERGLKAMNWDTAAKLPWGVLVLFGGGLSLAMAVETNGVSQFIGESTRGFGVLPPLLLLLAVTTMTVFLSEVTSNTAQVATMTPVLAAMGPALGMNPYMLVIVCALGASSGYMMPVGTPPNAIVFGTGLVRMPQMVRAGFVLNVAGILVIAALGWWLIPLVVAGRL